MSEQERQADILRVELRTLANLLREGLLPVEGAAVGYAVEDLKRVVADVAVRESRRPR